MGEIPKFDSAHDKEEHFRTNLKEDFKSWYSWALEHKTLDKRIKLIMPLIEPILSKKALIDFIMRKD